MQCAVEHRELDQSFLVHASSRGIHVSKTCCGPRKDGRDLWGDFVLMRGERTTQLPLFFFFLCWEMRDCGRLIVPSILFSFLFDGNEDGPWWACPALGLSVERQAAIVGGRWRDLVSCAKFSGEANEWARRGRRTKNWRWVGVCG